MGAVGALSGGVEKGKEGKTAGRAGGGDTRSVLGVSPNYYYNKDNSVRLREILMSYSLRRFLYSYQHRSVFCLI